MHFFLYFDLCYFAYNDGHGQKIADKKLLWLHKKWAVAVSDSQSLSVKC